MRPAMVLAGCRRRGYPGTGGARVVLQSLVLSLVACSEAEPPMEEGFFARVIVEVPVPDVKAGAGAPPGVDEDAAALASSIQCSDTSCTIGIVRPGPLRIGIVKEDYGFVAREVEVVDDGSTTLVDFDCGPGDRAVTPEGQAVPDCALWGPALDEYYDGAPGYSGDHVQAREEDDGMVVRLGMFNSHLQMDMPLTGYEFYGYNGAGIWCVGEFSEDLRTIELHGKWGRGIEFEQVLVRVE